MTFATVVQTTNRTNRQGGNMNAAAQVTADLWFTIDRDWTIVSCGDGVPGTIAQSVGMNIWQAFPGSETEYLDVYQQAWNIGHSAAVVYWNGTLTSVSAHRRNDQLLVSFDYLTVAGLKSTLERIWVEAGLSDPRAGGGSRATRTTLLRLVADAQ